MIQTNVSILKATIKEIGASKFIYFKSKLDYTYNGLATIHIEESYYIELQNRYNKKLITQLTQKKFDKLLIMELIKSSVEAIEELKIQKDQFRLSYAYIKSQNATTSQNKYSYDKIILVLDLQQNILKNIHSKLVQLSNEMDYLVDDDYKSIALDLEVNTNNTSLKDFDKTNKPLINLKKKDALSLILLLEHLEFIDFTGVNRNHFIERNFNYSSIKGEHKPLVNINSDISNLKDAKTYKARNKKSINSLVEKLSNKLNDFDFDKFLDNIS